MLAHIVCEGRDDATLVTELLIARGFTPLPETSDWAEFRILNRTFSSISIQDLPKTIRDAGGISVLRRGDHFVAVDDYRGAPAAIEQAANSFKELVPRRINRVALVLDADADVTAAWERTKNEFAKHSDLAWPPTIADGLNGVDAGGPRFHVFFWPDGGQSAGASEDVGIALVNSLHPAAVTAAETFATTGKPDGAQLEPSKKLKAVVSASASMIGDPAAANWVKIRDVAKAHTNIETVAELAPVKEFLDNVLA